MGMFDWVSQVPPVACRKCLKPIEGGWQSKDGDCQLNNIPYWNVRNFYTDCPHCNAWNEYRLKAAHVVLPLTDYELLGGDA
jgi:hypothetical protein